MSGINSSVTGPWGDPGGPIRYLRLPGCLCRGLFRRLRVELFTSGKKYIYFSIIPSTAVSLCARDYWNLSQSTPRRGN